MNAICKIAQFFGFAVASIIMMLVIFSVVVSLLPVETNVTTTVTRIK